MSHKDAPDYVGVQDLMREMGIKFSDLAISVQFQVVELAIIIAIQHFPLSSSNAAQVGKNDKNVEELRQLLANQIKPRP
jgi:hypothetical protein